MLFSRFENLINVFKPSTNRISISMTHIIKSLLILGLVVVALMFHFFYSIHNSYYQGVRAAESHKQAKTVAASLSGYYARHMKYPDRIDELNLEKTEKQYVGKVMFDNQTGVITIQLASESLSEGDLIFTPQINNNDKLSYVCYALKVPTEYIPKECAMKEDTFNSSSRSAAYDVE